jgi:predicted glycosyltransferase involved in capsule biosynthesis
VASNIAFIIPYWGTDPYRKQAFEYLQQHIWREFEGWDSVVYTRGGQSQSRSVCRNELATMALDAGAEILVFIDADSIPSSGAIQGALSTVMLRKSWLLPYTTYYNLTQEGSRTFMDSPPWSFWRAEDEYEYEYVFPGPDPRDRPASVGGSVIVHKEAWEKVKGYDERFRGWGGEDRAFAYALETMTGDLLRYPSPIYHLWHPAPEDQRFDNPDWERNRVLLERYEKAHLMPALMSALVKER